MRERLRRAAGLSGVAGLLLAGLGGVLAFARPGSSPPPSPAAPADSARQVPAAYLGLSGKLRAIELVADRPAPAPLAALVPALAQPGPGVHLTGLAAPDGEPIHLLSLLPFSAKPGGTWRGYRVGFWPGERTGRSRARYPLPDGFIEVTEAVADLPLSTHFRVRDFLTHDQPDTWPKLLVIRLPLLDKLELIGGALSGLGRTPALRVMSGFRTPQYNAQGVGPRGGRASDSRHMYGDAADIYVDADGDGRMDDMDGDGRVTVNDARWLATLAGQVEAAYPGVTGGIGVYRATSAHGPFVHVDVRGTPARW